MGNAASAFIIRVIAAIVARDASVRPTFKSRISMVMKLNACADACEASDA